LTNCLRMDRYCSIITYMTKEDEQGMFSYQFFQLLEEELTDERLVVSLCDFYNQAIKRENTERIYAPKEFAENLLLMTLQAEDGKIVYATNKSGAVVGFVGGYRSNFKREDFLLEMDIPEGKYYYMFGLGSSTGDPRVILGLINAIIDKLDVDYCVGLVSHEAPIYQRGIYQKRGWKEVGSGLPIAEGKSYFYIEKKEVIR